MKILYNVRHFRVHLKLIHVFYPPDPEHSRTVVLNLFRAVAHFKGPQIFVAHFDKSFDVIITMSQDKHKISWQ